VGVVIDWDYQSEVNGLAPMPALVGVAGLPLRVRRSHPLRNN